VGKFEKQITKMSYGPEKEIGSAFGLAMTLRRWVSKGTAGGRVRGTIPKLRLRLPPIVSVYPP
jgi:hypothetical protein